MHISIIKKLIILAFILIFIQFRPIAEAENAIVPSSLDISFQTDDVITAAHKACMIYDGMGYWQDAEFQTVGLHIFNQEEIDNTITLRLYASRRVYSITDGNIKEVAGSHYPVLISFVRNEDTLQLIQYQIPEEGSQYWKDMNAMFGKALANDIAKNREKYAKSATANAMQIAEQYLNATDDEKASLPCITFLNSGTISGSRDIILKSISGRYPVYIGKSISFVDKKLYTLSVEGEQSFSGILTYESFNSTGERIAYVKINVDENKLNVLDGELPCLYD